MKNILALDGPLMRFLNRVADILGASLLWILCSLPVVTVGAATVGLYTVAMEEDGGVWKPFFRGFRDSFSKATGLWLLLLGLAAVLGLDLQILKWVNGDWADWLQIPVWIVLILVVATAVYTFPLLSRYEQTAGQTLKNALFLALCHLPNTAVLLVIHLLPGLVAIVNPEMFTAYALPVLIFAGPGLIATLCTWRLRPLLAKHEAKP